MHPFILRTFAHIHYIVISANGRKNTVGGQAIIEGVMMRGKQKVSLAVKRPSGEITVESTTFISAAKKHRILGMPIARGAVNLFESLIIGYRALNRSAELAFEETPKNKPATIKEKASSALSLIIALSFSIILFMFLPMWVLSNFVPKESALLFNALAGALRIVLFLAYLLLISLWKDMRRVFEYHGAEHKAIFTYESGQDLSIGNMRKQSRFHPRCGTSFLLLVALVCIFLFSIIDALVIHYIGPYPSILIRLLTHLALVPVVAGISYEALKASFNFQDVPLISMLIKPGLALQSITTREPDDAQIEIAASALRAAV